MGSLPYYIDQPCPRSVRLIYSNHLRINVVCPIGSTRLNNRSRIQMIRSHAVDHDSGLLRKRLQFLAVELDSNNRCYALATRPYAY